MLAAHTSKRKSASTLATPTNGNNPNLIQAQQQQQPTKRKRTTTTTNKLSQSSGNQQQTPHQQRRQSGQAAQQSSNDGTQSRRLSSGSISMGANDNNQPTVASGSTGASQSADESVWIFGLINNIEQLLTTFNAINTNSSSSSSSAVASLAARNGSGSSTPSNSSSSSSTFSSTLSSPQSSPASANSAAPTPAVQKQQHLSLQAATSTAATGQTLARSPMSRQIKFHEYKGPPSSKRQLQTPTQNQQQQQQAQKQQTSIATDNISRTLVAAATKHRQQPQQKRAQPKADATDIMAVAGSESTSKVLAQASNHVSVSPDSSQASCGGQQQQRQTGAGQQQQSAPSLGDGGSFGLLNQATSGKDRMAAEFGVSLHHLQQQQQQHHQSLMNFHFVEPSPNGCFSAPQNVASPTNLMPVQTQAHILHHSHHQQQKDQQQQQQSLVRQVRLTSGPQCIGDAAASLQQASYAAGGCISQPTVCSDSIVVIGGGGDETTAVLASPSIETIHLNQQRQQQRQSIAGGGGGVAAGKIDPSESYHQHHNHQTHHLQQQQQQQLHLQPFCGSQLQSAPSAAFMIHATGHGSSNGSFVSRQLYSPIAVAAQPQRQRQQQQQQQTALKLQSSPMNSLAAPRTAPTANACVREQSAASNRFDRQQQQQQNITYRHAATAVSTKESFCAQQSAIYNNMAPPPPPPLNQMLDSNLQQLDDRPATGYAPMLNDDVDSLAVFGPDSEDIDACDIEPSIGSFGPGSDELLFSEFIDLQDVPMNVDESDWLKKFLPPCSMS